MISENTKKKIIGIWNDYISANRKSLDTKGNDLGDIDEKRVKAIGIINAIIKEFITGRIDVSEFKTQLDSYNKHNNLWGFTSIKGQMFFNLLLKNNDTDEQLKSITALLKETITKPKDLTEALKKIAALENYCLNIFSIAKDKRKAANPGSVGYFLSYFWQIYDHHKWPVMYSSMIVSFSDIGLWEDKLSQKDAYNSFYNLNEEVKQILSEHVKRDISNWETEHAFWNFRHITAYPKSISLKVAESAKPQAEPVRAFKETSFNIYEYLPPVIAKLVEQGQDNESTGAVKGNRFEKTVSEGFRLLGFDITSLGQGSGREPDLIAVYKPLNVAFIVDAKAYSNGYSMSAGDERAFRDYISHHGPRLDNEGIKKIGFIVVSNSFKERFEEFINEITWNTTIKRFVLLHSDALLHLLAYKLKDQSPITDIIDALVSSGSEINAQDIIEKFDNF